MPCRISASVRNGGPRSSIEDNRPHLRTTILVRGRRSLHRDPCPYSRTPGLAPDSGVLNDRLRR